MKTLILVGMLAISGCGTFQVSTEKNYWSKDTAFSVLGPWSWTVRHQYCVANLDEKTGVAKPVCYNSINADFGDTDVVAAKLDENERRKVDRLRDLEKWNRKNRADIIEGANQKDLARCLKPDTKPQPKP